MAEPEKKIEPDADKACIRSIRAMREEADTARRSRIERNEENLRIYLGQIDFGDKIPGQSTEHVPKVASSLEQFTAFIKRGLTQTGPDWFTIEPGAEPSDVLSPEQARALMIEYLDDIPSGGARRVSFPVLISDGIKSGLLESLIVFKVHGAKTRRRGFEVERGKFELRDGRLEEPEPRLRRARGLEWELRIDLIPPSEYYPDPSGRGLYEIHRVERDLHDVIEAAERGVYDMEEVERMIGTDFALPDDEERDPYLRNQDEAARPSFRKQVVIDEFWGTMLDDDGTVLHENIVAAVANDKFLIRRPEPNPFWHGSSPFVAAPLMRVPHSVWHRALYDDPARLNGALDELFNLMLDGGLASVWGTRQLRGDFLEDPRQVAGGIPQGTTLTVTDSLPPGAKVLETVTEGSIPGDAMAMLNLIEREFNFAALTSDLKMGMLPQRQVKATEVVESSQSQAATLDGIVSDIEQELMEPLLTKAWMVMLQNAGDLSRPRVRNVLGDKATLALARMSPAERFAALAESGRFKVHGLSSTLARSRDFQKFMAVLQVVTGNPLLMQSFFRTKSPDKIVDRLFKIVNLDPSDFSLSPEEQAQAQQRLQLAQQLQGISGPQRNSRSATGNLAARDTGGPEVPGEVSQLVNPLSGMTAV